MLIIPYDYVYHRESIRQILSKHDMDKLLIYRLPKFGLVAEHDGKVVAAGFLRSVEGNYCMMDGYITDPEVNATTRNRALDLITYKLLKIAKQNDIEKILAFTGVGNITTRAVNFGFNIINEKLLVRTF